MEDDINRLLPKVLISLEENPPPYNEDCGLDSCAFRQLWSGKCEPIEPPTDLEEFIEEEIVKFHPRQNGVGYPAGAPFLHIADVLNRWINEGYSVPTSFKRYDLLEEGDYPLKRTELFNSLSAKASGSTTLWSHWIDEEKQFFLEDMILRLGRRGLLDMLGLRKTQGTHEIFPPLRSVLEQAFEEKHSSRSELTVGARALAKHHHRDSAAFWGDSTGTESKKNEHALSVVTKILDNAAWINIHELPGQLPIIEMRVDEGYGARWSSDGTAFRGFLEPMMKEGWLNKYRH